VRGACSRSRPLTPPGDVGTSVGATSPSVGGPAGDDRHVGAAGRRRSGPRTPGTRCRRRGRGRAGRRWEPVNDSTYGSTFRRAGLLPVHNADNVYYVRSRIMSSQDGTQIGVFPTGAGVSYDGTYPDGRDTHPRVGTSGPGVGSEVAGDSSVVGPDGWAWDGIHSQGAAMSETPSSLDRFYVDLLHELGEFARRPSATAIGAAVVVKRVAQAHGVAMADRLPLPRFNRAEREERSETEWRNSR